MGLTSYNYQKVFEKNPDFSVQTITHKGFIKSSLFNQPEDYSATPIVMIGPGTGVVPYIGFMQEREMILQSNADK